MKVWVVMEGELYEGGRIMGIFLNEKKARELEKQLHVCSPAGWVTCTEYKVT